MQQIKIIIMSNLKKKRVSKITSVFLSATTAIWLSGAAALMPVAAQAQTVEDLQAQIASLLAMISTLQAQLSSLQGGTAPVAGACGYTFSKNLDMGDTGTDVMNLQKVLNSDPATMVAASGVGSSGSESSYFGSLTKGAVIKFQNKYASEVLTPIGLGAGTGYVGSMTRAKLNALYGTCGTPTTPTTPTTPAVTPGTGLTVTAGVQPTATLFPMNSTRVPFTVVNFTAGYDGPVTINSVVVERTGLAVDSVFSGVLIMDENNVQYGLAKTLNSSHQVTLTEPFVVPAGQTKKMIIAGNAQTSAGGYAGQTAYLSLVSVNSAATVSGSFPITGVGHSINETLTIGSVTVARGPLDPGADNSKEVGTTGYTFSSIRITATSAEKVRLLSVRWHQSGSAAASTDLANVKTYVEEVAYDTIVSSDGKYYTSHFNDGIVIDKGFSKEIYIKGDIAGGSSRTIDFDLYKRTDLYLKGETYKFGINPPNGTDESGTDDGAFHLNTNPWYDAHQATISSGTITVSKGTAVEAQNIAINLADQPLGGFHVEVKGEAVTVAQIVFRGTIGDSDSGAEPDGVDIDNVTLYNENGSVIAGPVDATGSAESVTITFTDTVTFPVGKGLYTLKGKLSTDFENNDTFSASTTPSTDWTTVTGQTTGTTITPAPTSAITGNQMTVKAGALAISVSSLPLAQTIIAGSNAFTFANYVLDAGNSGEDVSLNSLPVEYNAGANVTSLTNCSMWDGSLQLSTGSNVKNPSAASSGTSFVFDSPLIIAKGTTKTLSLKCDIAGNATAGNVFSWGYDATGCNPTPTGKVSGQDVGETETDSAGQYMTIAAEGTYTVYDDSTLGYTVVSAGATGQTLLKLKFAAVNEDIDIHRVALQLAGTASNTTLDLIGRKVKLYDASNPTVSIGEATFSTTDYATSSLIATGAFRVPSGGTKTMLVKGDIAGISYTVGPLQTSGDLLRLAYDGDSNGLANGNYGKGVSSGQTIDGTSSDITATGIRIFKAYPSFAHIPLLTDEKVLQSDSLRPLYKFSVTANGGDVYLYKTTFVIGSSTGSAAGASTSVYALTAYTNNSSGSFSGLDTTTSNGDGILNYNNAVTETAGTGKAMTLEIYPLNTSSASTTYKIPAGETRYLTLTATIETVETGTGSEAMSVKMEGDLAYPVNQAGSEMMAAAFGIATSVELDTNDDFIWSPNSTSSSIGVGDYDYTNGYLLPGLPTTNMAAQQLTSN